MSKYVAVVGGTGQIGTPMTKNLLKEGHKVRIVSRGKEHEVEEILNDHLANGAEFVVCDDMQDVDKVAEAIKGCEVFVATVPGSETIITKFEPVWVEAAVKAGIKRFVPSEFGCHTRSIKSGDGFIFDNKMELHEKIFKSGMDWTFVYNGYIFDYGLPNFRFYDEITTFGNVELPIYTHSIEDIGHHAALAITDDRTVNKCVQMDYRCLTQNEMVELVEKYWSNEPLVFKHYSTQYIQYMKDNSGDGITAKKGAETDRERWGINNVIYVLGKLAAFTDETLKASELWPDFVAKHPEEAIKDPKFFFEK